jgi:thiamine pyrophosphate-dependent acetolactate synthase large subunit-like protein
LSVTGNDLVARTLGKMGVKDFFFIMGGPLVDAQRLMVAEGIRAVDTRHEQAAAMMAHAYSRVTGGVGLCMGCSGPGALNLLTGIASAWADCVPVVAIGGSSPTFQSGMGTFQEVDQVAVFEPVTKWSYRVPEASRIPDVLEEAFRRARTGRPGPVYLDFPADVLYEEVPDEKVRTVPGPPAIVRNLADPADVTSAIQLLSAAERPLLVAGSGVLWSEAWTELHEFVDLTGIPFYTTPQGRGMIPEDHPLAFLYARSQAFREADVVFVVGTRINHMINFGKKPRFHESAQFVQLDIAPDEIGQNRAVAVRLAGDARLTLQQLIEEARQQHFTSDEPSAWARHLDEVNQRKCAEHEQNCSTDQVPIHPLRLAKEVRDVLDPDTILVVDGHDLLNFSRQTIPSYLPRHRLNSGPFGTMGVGLPFAVGAKAAAPDKQVVVVHGDGSFGMNCMELDTAMRLDLPVVCVIGNNAGWTSAQPERQRPGVNLGHTRYESMFEPLGAYVEFVRYPGELRPALLRALASGRTAVVNVLTDPTAKSETARYTPHAST